MLPDANILYGSDFPYSSSSEAVAGLAANGLPAPALAGIEGANAYALYDKHWYGELGLYKSLSTAAINMVNGSDVGRRGHGARGGR